MFNLYQWQHHFQTAYMFRISKEMRSEVGHKETISQTNPCGCLHKLLEKLLYHVASNLTLRNTQTLAQKKPQRTQITVWGNVSKPSSACAKIASAGGDVKFFRHCRRHNDFIYISLHNKNEN